MCFSVETNLHKMTAKTYVRICSPPLSYNISPDLALRKMQNIFIHKRKKKHTAFIIRDARKISSKVATKSMQAIPESLQILIQTERDAILPSHIIIIIIITTMTTTTKNAINVSR